MRNAISSWKAIIAKIFVAALIVLSVAAVPAAVKAADAPSLNKSSRNIFIGNTYNLKVMNQVEGSTYVWSTSDNSIASVTQNGAVKGKKVGNVVITCTVTAPDANYSLTCNVTIIQRALVFSINNKVTELNVGQVYDLNRTLKPASSNDKTKWTSSDKSIAAPNKYGKFTALKAGTVTITGTTLSGKSDSVTIKVVDAGAFASTQEELNALLNAKAQKITFKTDAKVDITIPSGQYTGTTLVVDAPNADVHNNGVFAKIDIVKIAANSWYENAVGNLLNILSDTSRVVVAPTAVVKIEVSAEGAKLVIENNGMVEEFVVAKPADIDIKGESKQEIPLAVTIPGVTITTSVPLNLECKATKLDLVLLAGAEKTVLTADKIENIPTVSSNVAVNITVGTGENKEVKKVEVKPVVDTTTPTVITPPVSTPKITKSTSGNVTTYTLSEPYANLSSVVVSYQGLSYTINGDLLTKLKSYLAAESKTITTWQNTTNTTKTFSGYTGQSVTVTSTANVNTKLVTFNGTLLGGKSYNVTVNASTHSVTVVSNQSNVTFTISMIDNYTLKFETAMPSLYFSPSF